MTSLSRTAIVTVQYKVTRKHLVEFKLTQNHMGKSLQFGKLWGDRTTVVLHTEQHEDLVLLNCSFWTPRRKD